MYEFKESLDRIVENYGLKETRFYQAEALLGGIMIGIECVNSMTEERMNMIENSYKELRKIKSDREERNKK